MFGQHEHLLMHGQSLYQEETHVPLLIYSPKIFKPGTIRAVTSSVDILPLILETMGIQYGTQLQGEAQIKIPSERKYVFVYGEQDNIAAISRDNMKMIISFSNDSCVTYDLKKDPHEQRPLLCSDLNQQRAILKFRNFQPKIISWYNGIRY